MLHHGYDYLIILGHLFHNLKKKKKKKKKNLCYNVCNENTVNNPCCHGYDNQILVTLAPGSVKLAPGADCICSCKSNCHTIMTICFLVDKGLL